MPPAFKDHFSAAADAHAAFRPRYPAAPFDWADIDRLAQRFYGVTLDAYWPPARWAVAGVGRA